MADQFEDQFPGDSTIAVDGDSQWVGMNTRVQPDKLERGYAQLLQNIRLDNLSPTVRLGTSKQTNSINPGSAPLYVPFTVGTSATISGGATNGIYASCKFSDPNNSNESYIFMATGNRAYWIDTKTQAVGNILYPSNEIVENTDPSTDMFQVGGNVYILRGDVGTSFSVSSVTSSGTTATVTTASSITGLLFSGQYVRIGGANQPAYNGDFAITTTGTSTFTFTMTGSTTSPATGTVTANRLKIPLKWTGNFASSFVTTNYGVISQNFSYMPTSNFGLLQQNRVILEQGRNSLEMSQVNGFEAYDTINGDFTFALGTADYLIGAAAYQDTQTLVFNRNSIWLVNGVNGDVASMTTQLITDTVGCVSRHSISTCGANVLFLSDKGVYMLQPGLELLLRGNSLPLSAPIDATIQTINYAATQAPYAAYFRSRYYLAVPVNGATRNNTVLVYNFINSQWESIDTFPNGFFVDQMQVSLNGSGTPTLYFISFEGGIYAAEQNQTDDFSAASIPPTQYPIQAKLQTRRYTFGSTNLKKFNRATSVIAMTTGAAVSATVNTYGPEDSRTIFTANTSGTSATLTRPALINKRAYAVDLTFANTTGRFSLNNLTVGAYEKDRKTVTTT